MNEKDIINKISDDNSKKKEILKKEIAKIVKENIPFNRYTRKVLVYDTS